MCVCTEILTGLGRVNTTSDENPGEVFSYLCASVGAPSDENSLCTLWSSLRRNHREREGEREREREREREMLSVADG